MSEKVYANYIYDSCYSLEYGELFIVFDYARGILDIPETKHSLFFVTENDEKAYTTEIFNLEKLKSIDYIINESVRNLKYQDNVIYLNKDELGMKELKDLYNRQEVKLVKEGDFLNFKLGDKNLKVKCFSLDRSSLAYLIRIDSLVIFYGGHINFDTIDDEAYLDLLDYLEEEKIDIIFLPIYPLDEKSLAYLDSLVKVSESQIFFPTNIGGREAISKEFKDKYKNKALDIRQIEKLNEEIEIEVDWFSFKSLVKYNKEEWDGKNKKISKYGAS